MGHDRNYEHIGTVVEHPPMSPRNSEGGQSGDQLDTFDCFHVFSAVEKVMILFTFSSWFDFDPNFNENIIRASCFATSSISH
jgi:hypothetical protein